MILYIQCLTDCAVQACQLLSQQLPCYGALVTVAAPAATAPWLADSVLAARVHFLLGTLVPCAARLTQASLPPLHLTVLSAMPDLMCC